MLVPRQPVVLPWLKQTRHRYLGSPGDHWQWRSDAAVTDGYA
jgi:hypothetical protein